ERRLERRAARIPPRRPRLRGPLDHAPAGRRRPLGDAEAMSAGRIKERAAALGFDLCGIARAHALDPAPFAKFFDNGWSADLQYLQERLAERLDPRVLLPGARSVIVVAAS